MMLLVLISAFAAQHTPVEASEADPHVRSVMDALGLVASIAPSNRLGVVLPGELEFSAPAVPDAAGRTYGLGLPAQLAGTWIGLQDDGARSWRGRIAQAPIDWVQTVVATPSTVRFSAPDATGRSRTTFTLSRSRFADGDAPSFDVRIGVPCSCRLIGPEVVTVADAPVEVVMEWDRTQLLDVRGLPITLDVIGGQPVAVMVEFDDVHPFVNESPQVEVARHGTAAVRVRLAPGDVGGPASYGLFQKRIRPNVDVRVDEVAPFEFDVTVEPANDYDYAPIELTARVGSTDYTLSVKPTEPWPEVSATGAVRLYGSAMPGERVLIMRSRADGEVRLAFPDRLADVAQIAPFEQVAELVVPPGAFGFWTERRGDFEVHLREDAELMHGMRSWLTNW